MSVQTNQTSSHPISRFIEPEFRPILCYPSGDEKEAEARIKELGNLKISAICLEGSVGLGRLHILGKGCVSLVVKAIIEGQEPCALKIRRVDANRPTMQVEASLLSTANSVGVGPKLFSYSENFLAMQLIVGAGIDEYILKRDSLEGVRQTIKDLLNQCRALDRIGLSHGELSNLRKHVVVSEEGKAFILDFESASLNRNSSNVTAAAQHIFISGPSSHHLRKLLRRPEKLAAIESLKKYKQSRSDEAYNKLIATLL